MTLGIMQPYFLPYVGYFQLMMEADVFVYYDDVNYIKQGWINRNNILLDGENYRFTLELKGASSFKKINEIEVGKNREKLYKTFVQAYSNSKYFLEFHHYLHKIFHSEDTNLFNYILETHKTIFEYLDIDITYLISSTIDKDNSLKGQDKVLHICNRLNANSYVNAIGGQKLYSKDVFKTNNIDLRFLQTAEHLPKRSIIDVIMNYSPEEIRTMLTNYELI